MKIVPCSVELLDYMGGDDAVCDAARVSFGKEASQYSEEQNAKLISYLAKHNHWSPFAHSFLKFRIKAPIFVSRQMVKHQVGLSWNEVSRRYVDDEPEYFLPATWRSRPENGIKQGSGDDHSESDQFYDDAYYVAKACHNLYLGMVRNNVAPEQARMVLPQNTMTEWVWSGSLMAFARVCKQRLDPHAQRETQEVAQLIHQQIPKEFANSWKALLG